MKVRKDEDEVNVCLQVLNRDKRLMNVRSEYRKEYAEYLKVLDDREKEGRKPISFDDFLWEQDNARTNIEANKVKSKYDTLFEEMQSDLNSILCQYKFDAEAANLNNLKLKLGATMDRYKSKMYKISNKGGKVNEN